MTTNTLLQDLIEWLRIKVEKASDTLSTHSFDHPDTPLTLGRMDGYVEVLKFIMDKIKENPKE